MHGIYPNYDDNGIAFGFCIDIPSGYYKIRYHANSGNGTMSDQIIEKNTATNLTQNTFTKDGYIFKGWNTKEDGTGTSYTNRQSVNHLADGGTINLYAQWEEIHVKYAVQIYGINQDVDENDNPIGLTFGPAAGANYNNSYVTHEYEETSNGSGVYNVKIITHTVSANNTETTTWEYLTNSGGTNVTRNTAEMNKYNVNIHNMTWEQIANEVDKTKFLDCMLCGDTKSVDLKLNGTIASGSVYNQYGDGAGIICDTLKLNYRRWNLSSTDNSAAINGKTHGSNAINAGGYSSSHIRATLIGENNKTDITYAGDENLTSTNSLYSCIESDLQSVIAPKKTKYMTGTDYNSGNYTVKDDISDKIWLFSNRELYGPGEYSGSNAEGLGVNGDGYDRFGNSDSKYRFSIYTNSPTAKRTYYRENGYSYYIWLRSILVSEDSIYDIEKNGKLDYFISINSTLGISFGFCLQGQHQVTFNANNGTGTMSPQTITNNVPTNLSANTFTRANHVFAGWNTAADGSGTSYTDGQQVTNLGNVTLYAQWKQPVKYAVQIYGINQDVGADNNTLGLTFGPALGSDYNNKYVTHTYEETSSGSGNYYVKIVTHTVAADGTETASEEYLYKDGGTTTKVVRTMAEKNKYDINMHNMSWAEIAAVNDKTAFLDCMLCGDTKSVCITLNSTIETGNLYDQYGDGAGMLYNTINNYYKKWNPNQTDNSYVGTGVTLSSGEQNYGSNARNAGGYSSSHMRATLVGEDSKTNKGYAGDVNLDSTNSLYACIESDLQNVITAKKIKYVTGTNYTSGNYNLNADISDKIWLLSDREMCGTGQYSGATIEGVGTNGEGYNRFVNNESKYYISSGNDSAVELRIGCSENGSHSYWWLRSPGLRNTTDVRYVGSTGYLSSINYGGANLTFGLAFGFCIK